MTHTATKTLVRNAILLARLSDNREDLDLTDEGIPRSLDDQVQRMRERARELKWNVLTVIQNPRLSAYKTKAVKLPDGRTVWRVWRPDLREALDLLSTGKANAMLALDLDRAFRDGRDLQDLIDVVEHSPHDIVVESVTGSLHLERGYDNFNAQILVLVANRASRDAARRQTMSRERRAKAGKFGGGRRPYGFEADGVTVRESEKDVIADCTKRLLQGTSLRAMAAELRERIEVLPDGFIGPPRRGVPTVTGARWTAETLRDILIRPRNAGRLIYRGEELPEPAPWKPLVDPEDFDVVVKLFEDRKGTGTAGAAPKHLGSGLYRCGKCGSTVQVLCGSRGVRRYRCKAHAHLTRNQAGVDKLVLERVCALLRSPDLATKLNQGKDNPEADVDALTAKRAALREFRKSVVRNPEEYGFSAVEVKAAMSSSKEKLDRIDAELSTVNVTGSASSDVANSEEPVKVFLAAPVSTQQQIIRELLYTVTLMPVGQTGRGFTEASVHMVRTVTEVAA